MSSSQFFDGIFLSRSFSMEKLWEREKKLEQLPRVIVKLPWKFSSDYMEKVLCKIFSSGFKIPHGWIWSFYLKIITFLVISRQQTVENLKVEKAFYVSVLRLKLNSNFISSNVKEQDQGHDWIFILKKIYARDTQKFYFQVGKSKTLNFKKILTTFSLNV